MTGERTVSDNQTPTPTLVSAGGNDWDLAGSTRISNEETTRLLAEYQRTHDVTLRNTVVQANLRLVAYLAGRFKGRGLTIDELMSEGAAALIRATETFDTTRGVSFGAYVATAITHSMRRALGCARHVVTVPSQVRRRITRHRRATDTFFALHGRQPSHTEISKEVREKGPAAPVGSVEPGATTELSADQTQVAAAIPGGFERIATEDLRSRVREAVGTLDQCTADVICLRFGLDSGAPRTWQRVAEQMGISVSEARARAADGMMILRGRLAAEQDVAGEGRVVGSASRRWMAA
jgi:RNA polymerase primary sigma factor